MISDFQLNKLKKVIDEVLKDGYGKVSWEITIKNGKIDYTSLTKTITSRIA